MGTETMLKLKKLAVFGSFLTIMPVVLFADRLPGSISAIERYNYVERSYITEPFDIFCLSRPGFMVEIPWDASSFYGDSSKGEVVVELINMGLIECKHGWDLHLMGNHFQGSSGSAWVAVYKDEYIVRFSALDASVFYLDNGEPIIKAKVHPLYCEEITTNCRIEFALPMNDSN